MNKLEQKSKMIKKIVADKKKIGALGCGYYVAIVYNAMRSTISAHCNGNGTMKLTLNYPTDCADFAHFHPHSFNSNALYENQTH